MSELGGFEIEDGPDGLTMVVTSGWSTEAERRLGVGDVTGLTLNYALGFQEPDLEFLRDWPIRRLTILARTITDLTPVYRTAPTLERLSVQSSPSARIDLRRLPWLTAVAADWQQVADTIEYALALNDLFAASYNAPDLHPLRRNEALVRLQMKQHPKLRSLDGLAELRSMREVGIFGARAMDDISALDIRAGAPTLERLNLDSCSAFTSLEPLSGQKLLEVLGIANCGPVESLLPIGDMQRLQRLHAYESTRIADGDLSPVLGLLALRDLRMMNRRHYKPSVQEVKRRLGLPD
ncbi:MAG: hypothetical protein GC157_15005 [Frankiales bacterium]|nr:hypothetical protein [Frankiales bacterium]